MADFAEFFNAHFKMASATVNSARVRQPDGLFKPEFFGPRTSGLEYLREILAYARDHYSYGEMADACTALLLTIDAMQPRDAPSEQGEA